MPGNCRRIRILRPVAAVGILLMLAWPTVTWWHWGRVSFHRKQCLRYWEGSLSRGFSLAQLPILERFMDPAADGITEDWEEELGRRHILALIELGALEYQLNEMKHLHHETREGRHFIRFIMGHTPDGILWSSDCPQNPEPIRFRTWMEPSKVDEWRRLLTRYDVPNYWEIRDQSVRLPEEVSKH